MNASAPKLEPPVPIRINSSVLSSALVKNLVLSIISSKSSTESIIEKIGIDLFARL